jgi:hypothetical protein
MLFVRTNLFFTGKNTIPEKQDISAREKNHGKRGALTIMVNCLFVKWQTKKYIPA